MSFWTLATVAEALGSYVTTKPPRGPAELGGISTDSRSVSAGQLFVALIGEKFDGHDYVEAALRQGVSAVIVSRPVRIESPGVAVYEVPDTLVALGRLASHWRRAWGGALVMVAGSNGKTTTKDLIRVALSRAMRVHATTGNLNNRIGVPLTLLAIPHDCEIAVVEAGTNLPGEVAILRAIADPDISVVTSVAEEHLEGLGDLAGVLREEAAAFDGVRIAITPASQPEIGDAAHERAEEVITAGLDEGDVKPDSWSISSDGVGTVRFGNVTMTPPLRGIHNLRNAMLAIAVSRACGVSDEIAAAGIEAMPALRMRVAWEQLGRATLINDAYNANPGSTRAAIELVKSVGPGRQRVIVLGTMRELGEASTRCHDDISRLALDSGADVVAGIGEFAESLARIGKEDPRIVTAESVSELWPRLFPRMQPDAVILLKASRGVQLEQLVPHLTTWANP
ncbi:MAG: UDP-N-acetylmuramoyl-tripeptide--D-alanyl-D-alanine ligase [Gemmatimonadaceae bacterium]|nr:UDP-N-acetylmuramoyl-tripeptide--D-alanyl-D-alanine ligase [Gemmatimonadaceae bacterium]